VVTTTLQPARAHARVIGALTLSIDRVRDTARRSLADLETTDAVAHDITVEVLEGLEKYRWMLQAQKI
jgi:DNA-binding ferritin-like protein